MARKKGKKLKTLKITPEVHKRLVAHGRWGESIYEIIDRLLDEVEGKHAE